MRCTRDALKAVVELALGRLRRLCLMQNSSPNLYLPKISRTRQTVRTLRRALVRLNAYYTRSTKSPAWRCLELKSLARGRVLTDRQ